MKIKFMNKTKKQENNRALELIKKITWEIKNARPSKEKMLEEIKMMNFKIRPIVGDVFEIAKRKEIFLESLWKIGKIEQIISGIMNKLTEEERDMFLQFMERLQSQMEEKLTSFLSNPSQSFDEKKEITILELEIFKEKNINKRRLN